MPDPDAEATARAEADPKGLGVLDAVDVGGTWTVIESGDTAPPPAAKPAAPPTSSELAERPPVPAAAPPPPPNLVAPPPRPNGQWRPVEPAPAGAGRPRGGRWLIAAAIVAGLAVAVPLAVGAATFAYRVTNPPMPRAGSAPGHYLADASSRRIEVAAVSRGLRCGTPPQSAGSGGTAQVRVCQRVSGSRVATVAMAGSAGHLVAVTAGVGGVPPDEPADLALLHAIIDATVARRDAAGADTWLSAHFDQPGDSQTVVNGVMLRLGVRDSVRSLVIVPAP